MCGIAGFAHKEFPPAQAVKVLEDFSARLSHRGPDNTGYCLWSQGGSYSVGESAQKLSSERMGVDIGLMHRRLSILDTSEHGHQPMVSHDDRYVIVQNGEIYNYIELRSELENLGYSFASQSDTEVLLYALIEWGRKAFAKLIGMFAFCLIDRVDQTLMLARDFYGIKPLFYATTEKGLVFASEIKALSAFPELKLQPDLFSLRDYLALGLVNHNERSFLSGIKSLPPGHCLKISLGRSLAPEISSFLAPKQARLNRKEIGFVEASQELKERFLRSVELHMRSDVGYGALLSGGVDSSAIVAAMRLVGGEELDLRTFTYAARGESCDEEAYADLVINKVGANSKKVLLSSNDVVQNLERLMRFQDEPIGSTSLFAQYRVFEAVHNDGLKVVLDGQGADEILGGYTPYYTAALAGFIQKGEWGRACSLIGYLRHNGRLSLSNLLLRTLTRLAPDFVGQMIYQKHAQGGVNAAIDWQWFEKMGISADYGKTTGLASSLDSALDLDFTSLNLPGLLRYEDRNSMAHSLESRVPFLSPEIVGFVQSLPEEYLISPDGEDKALFRAAMRGIVPDEILDRKDKIGFQTPEQAWFKELSGWVEERINSDSFRALPFLDVAQATRSWEEVKRSGNGFPRAVWRWINVAQWAEAHDLDFEKSV
ncbi:asparagine synthase (glutamine-hydrolyzing) [Kiloniella sp.]|uniref:asparagine synthase (glutamine-hydrolyzing) n=1 Tax=Kiloniella sp. TaxID=1938587 RepID=UPI003A925122